MPTSRRPRSSGFWSIPRGARQARDGEALFGTIDTWLIWKLTNGAVHVTDHTNASRTMLMNLATGEWDDDLLQLSSTSRERCCRGLSRRPRWSAYTAAGASGRGDSHRGHRRRSAGRARGTGLFPAGAYEEHVRHRMFRADAYRARRCPFRDNKLLATRARAGRLFAIEGSIFVAGAAVQWLRDKLGLLTTAAESETLARSVPDTGGVYFVPAFVGLGAPHWDGVRGA